MSTHYSEGFSKIIIILVQTSSANVKVTSQRLWRETCQRKTTFSTPNKKQTLWLPRSCYYDLEYLNTEQRVALWVVYVIRRAVANSGSNKVFCAKPVQSEAIYEWCVFSKSQLIFWQDCNIYFGFWNSHHETYFNFSCFPYCLLKTHLCWYHILLFVCMCVWVFNTFWADFYEAWSCNSNHEMLDHK